MILFPNASVTRLRAATVPDPYGNDEENWGAATEVEYTGWHIQPIMHSENDDVDRNQFVTRYRAYVPAGHDVAKSDRVIWDEVTYEVEADPEVWLDTDGSVHHLESVLKRVEG